MSSHVSSNKLHTSIRATHGSITAKPIAISRSPTKHVTYKKSWISRWLTFLIEAWREFMIATWWYK